MLYNLQGALVVLVSIVGAACFLLLLPRIWPIDSRRLQNELIHQQDEATGRQNRQQDG